MNYSLGNDLYIEMMNWEFIKKEHQFNTGRFINEERIGPVPLKKSPTSVNVFNQYALVVTVNDQFEPDTEVVQSFGFNNKTSYSVKKGPYELL